MQEGVAGSDVRRIVEVYGDPAMTGALAGFELETQNLKAIISLRYELIAQRFADTTQYDGF